MVKALPSRHKNKDSAIRAAKAVQQTEGCSVRVIDTQTENIVYQSRIDDRYFFED
jgi:hypothetical protein